MRNFDASTEIKKFATSQIQKTASKSSKIDEISRSKYIKYLQQCGYIDKRASLDSGKVISKSTDLISKAKAVLIAWFEKSHRILFRLLTVSTLLEVTLRQFCLERVHLCSKEGLLLGKPTENVHLFFHFWQL